MAIPLKYSLRSIAVRKGSSAMAVGGIAPGGRRLRDAAVAGGGLPPGRGDVGQSTAMSSCCARAPTRNCTSQVLRETARVISELPCVAEQDGQKLVVFESVIILARPKQGGGETNVTIRGTQPLSRAVHADVRLDARPLVHTRFGRSGAGRGPGPPAERLGYRPDA